MHIYANEFLAALIAFETSEFCKGQMTTLKLDNVTAKYWIEGGAERCGQYSPMYDTVYKNSKNIENELHFMAKN